MRWRWMGVVILMLATNAGADNLFKEAEFRSPVSDRRAFRVGDTLMVMVVENSSASASADTSSDKQADMGFKLAMPNLQQRNASLGLNQDFAGKGRSLRAGKMLAQISVTVMLVKANGDLDVAGEQLMEINDEKQSIKLEGRVRQADIGDNNTVLSTKLANARISYIGDGILTDAQKRGWIPRFFSWLGLI